MGLLQFLLNASLCLVPFYLLYIVLMRRFTFFNWNRWYIISSLLLCVVIPFLRVQPPEIINYYIPQQNWNQLPAASPAPIVTAGSLVNNAPAFNWLLTGLVIYLAGVAVTAVRLLINLRQVILFIRQGSKTAYEGYYIIRGKHISQNASFFRYIFLQHTLQPEEVASVVLHESIHARQWHTADILLVECCKVLLWFHPAVYHYKKLLQQVHEFEVDSEVTALMDKKEYAHLLLKLQSRRPLAIANLYSAGGTRKRIEMLFTQKSIAMKKVFYLLVVPCLLVTATYCSRKDQLIKVHGDAAQVIYKKYGIVEEDSSHISYTLLPEKIADLKDYHDFLYKGEFDEVGKLFEKYGVSSRALTTSHTTGTTDMCGFMLNGKKTEAQAFANVNELLHKKQVMVCAVDKTTGKVSVTVDYYNTGTAGNTGKAIESGTGSFFIDDENQLLLCINLTAINSMKDKNGLNEFIEHVSASFKKEGYTGISMNVVMKGKEVNSISDIDEMTFGLQNPVTGEQSSAAFKIDEMIAQRLNVICRVDKKTHTIEIKKGQMPLATVGATLFNDNCAACHIANAGAPVLAGIEQRRSKEWIYAFTRNSSELLAKGDKQALEIYNQWNQAPMNSFPNLRDEEINAIVEFIKTQKS